MIGATALSAACGGWGTALAIARFLALDPPPGEIQIWIDGFESGGAWCWR